MRVDFAALKHAVLVVDVLARHGIELHRNRRTRCPLHTGTNDQSFSVTSDARRWTCFASCGSGDALDLEQRLAGVGLRTAAETLARLAGLPGAPTAAPVDRNRLARRRDRERTLRHWAALRCLSATDVARVWDACAYRQHCAGRLEIAATGEPSEQTLDALARIYVKRDHAERDVDFYVAGDLKALADAYFEAQS